MILLLVPGFSTQRAALAEASRPARRLRDRAPSHWTEYPRMRRLSRGIVKGVGIGAGRTNERGSEVGRKLEAGCRMLDAGNPPLIRQLGNSLACRIAISHQPSAIGYRLPPHQRHVRPAVPGRDLERAVDGTAQSGGVSGAQRHWCRPGGTSVMVSCRPVPRLDCEIRGPSQRWAEPAGRPGNRMHRPAVSPVALVSGTTFGPGELISGRGAFL